MRILFSLMFSFFYFYSMAAHSETWFSCPEVHEITQKGDRDPESSSLEASTTREGVTITWSGWIKSQYPLIEFKHIHLEGINMDQPRFIVCYYKDQHDNYALLYPKFAEYKGDGRIRGGAWVNNICRSQNPRDCLFSVVKSN